jgi:LmbE family N-acetylglucosaminyl deacetylase
MFFLLTHGATTGMTPLMDLLAEYPSVLAQSLIIFYLLANKIVSERSFRPRRILIVGAHPDDMEIASGAGLARINDMGHTVFGLVMTHGGRGGEAEVRLDEAQEGAKFLGLTRVKIMDFTDTKLSEHTEWFRLLKRIHGSSDLILTHSIHVVHQVHHSVYSATLRAGRKHNSLHCYESPSVTQEFRPTFFINACGYVDVKIEAVRTHLDQRNKPYMSEEQVRGKLAFRGGQAKVEYAEGYEVIRLLSSALGEF